VRSLDRRGVSETLGFVLVFAIVIATVAVVMTAGYGSLQTARESEQLQNAERAFEVMADNMADISQRGAPSRATEIKLRDAEIYVAEPTFVNVSIKDGQDFHNSTVRPIIYESKAGGDDAAQTNQVIYANGAIMRGSQPGSAVIREPPLNFGDRQTSIVVTGTFITGATPPSVSGSETVLVRGDSVKRDLVIANDSGSVDVYYNVTSPRADVWKQYLERTQPGSDACPGTANKVCWEFTTDRIYVTLSSIRVDVD
jgi:type II secretory pathway pseudopilin PulG